MTSLEKLPIVLAIRHWDVAPWFARFRASAPDREIIVAEPGFDAPPRAYVLCAWKAEPIIYQLQPPPQLICSLGAGVDHIMRANPPAGVPVTRIVDPDLTGRMVEYVVLHALHHFRRMSEHAVAQSERRWLSLDQPAAREVTVGLMGVGEMGQAAAKGLMAIGFKVVGWGRTARPCLGFEGFAGADGLHDFLGKTDILVSLLPSTPETFSLIGMDLFCHLRNSGPLGAPAFINAGRGDTVNEQELIAALRMGIVRAASLDVFRVEPLPPQSPFWEMPNVVLTPHNAADSSPDAIVTAVLAEIARAEAGLPALHPVDPAQGY